MMKISTEALVFMTDSDIKRICEGVEPDLIKSLSLKLNLQVTRKAFLYHQNQTSLIQPVPVVDTLSTRTNDSKSSLFDTVSFPERSEKSRDTNKWPLVLGRRYKCVSDPVPVSSFINLLVSFGIKESVSSSEFFRYVTSNLEIDFNVQVVNFLISKGCIDDSASSERLTRLHDSLKSSFSITDTPSILRSRLEKLHQESESIAEFSQKFNKHLCLCEQTCRAFRRRFQYALNEED
jgi:hypothetical protein